MEAVEIAIRHSRRIHLLLADDGNAGRTLAARLIPYRPDMDVIHIGGELEKSAVLTEVPKFLGRAGFIGG